MRALVEELGLGDDIVAPAPGGAWVVGLPGSPGAAPLPKGGVLGIPDNPFADDVRRVIGWRGAWRAYLDRLRPPLTIGHERSLGRLVRTRMGAAVLDRLVAPVTTGVYSSHPDDIDVDVAAPGLNSALTRAGSLVRRGRRCCAASAPTAARARRSRESTAGCTGSSRRSWQAARRIRGRGAHGGDRRVRRTDGRRLDASRWPGRAAESGGCRDRRHSGGRRAAPARARPCPTLGTAALRPGPDVHVVTLVLDAPALDAHPRGTGVLTVAGARAGEGAHPLHREVAVARRPGARRPARRPRLVRQPGRAARDRGAERRGRRRAGPRRGIRSARRAPRRAASWSTRGSSPTGRRSRPRCSVSGMRPPRHAARSTGWTDSPPPARGSRAPAWPRSCPTRSPRPRGCASRRSGAESQAVKHS